MLDNATSALNHNKALQSLGIFSAVIIAIASFILTVNSLGIFRFGQSGKPAVNNNGLLVQTQDFKFAQEEIYVSVGTDVKLALFNEDVLAHSFDVDELDLHIAMPANDSAERSLTITQSGTYTFYCAVPGHRQAGMVGTLIVE